jgi:hypothetical protein
VGYATLRYFEETCLYISTVIKGNEAILDTIQCEDESGGDQNSPQTQEDPQRALYTLLNFFKQAPRGLVTQNEYVTVQKLTGKLRLQQNNEPLSGGLRRTAEQDLELSPRHTTATIIDPGSSPSTGGALNALLHRLHTKWGWEEDIGGDVHDLLEVIETHGTSGPLSPSENIFILISMTIPKGDQVSFTAAVLAEIDKSFSLFPPERPMDWDPWLVIHDSSNLETLQETVDLPLPLKLYLDDGIPPQAVKLVLNAFVVLAAERTLSNVKEQILRHRLLRPRPGAARTGYFATCRQIYHDILGKLHTRKLKVGYRWYSFIGRVFSWETYGDELFVSSEEESNDSGDDSAYSEDEST